MSVLHDKKGYPIDNGNPMPTGLKTSDIIQPTDLQTRYSQTIQTHNAVSVSAGAESDSVWIDSEGFNEVGGTFMNDAGTSSEVRILWSNDGTNAHGYESVASGANSLKQFTISTRARYFKIRLYNGDTLAHTMSAWAFLKV